MSKIHRENKQIGQLNAQFTIWYDKDRRTYWVSSSPVEVETRDNGIVITSYSAYSGFKEDLLTVTRASAKHEKTAINILNGQMEYYINWYKNRYPDQTK